ncbi:MAG: CaiB/BaiF CoA-transferase family protein [Pseudomonadales bacterium]|nr:CaiB/BaiF CoA-transferase family protein [Pseudomonadales bacterium]
MSGPLSGFKIIEIAGIGPGQLCGMLLADLGATLIRIDRKEDADLGIGMPAKYNLMNRSRHSVAVDLKTEAGVNFVKALVSEADALFEGFRPGVMERLGLGPDICADINSKLVYGRMTGWGQDGPMAQAVGHDPNYIALTGVLASIGPKDGPPAYPLNLVGDFGGGGVYLAFGMLAALLEVGRSGKGQTVDSAMVDGIASMMTLFHGMLAGGMWQEKRGHNMIDAGAPNVHVYETEDGGHVAVGAVEARFFKNLTDTLGLDIDPNQRNNPKHWTRLITEIQTVFLTKTRDEWAEVFADVDACVSPVLSLTEATEQVHLTARETYVEFDGIVQPAPAPRFSRTPGEISSSPTDSGSNNQAALSTWNMSAEKIQRLEQDGVLLVKNT